jgi:tripartite-type tricarboxylate transporter receptor subunit TctC
MKIANCVKSGVCSARRHLLSAAALTAVSLALTGPNARAEGAYPTQPIKMVVGLAAGGATDVLARIVARGLSERLGQQVVVENKVGAGGSVAADSVARSKPDGYTLLFVSSTIAVNPAVYSKLPMDVNTDLTPIALIGRGPLIMFVNSSFPAQNLREFIAYAKAKPNGLNFGSSGYGGTAHLATESFATTAGIKMTHVPFRGNSYALTALFAGDIALMMDAVITVVPHLNAGKVRALAITGDTRSPLVPDVPTFREAGLPEYNLAGTFFGVMGPAGMPRPVVDRINSEIASILKSKDLGKQLSEAGGLTLAGGSPEDFQAMLRKELALWKKIATESKVAAD